MKTAFPLVIVTIFYFLHQDFWNWSRYEPLLFGFLPPGLAYHVGYSLAVAVMMKLLVHFAWPANLDSASPELTEESSNEVAA